MYAAASLVVEGALEEEQTFYDKTLLDDYAARLENELRGDGVDADLFVIFHDHEEGIECECVQFLQDHKPYREYRFNPAGSEA